MLELCIFGAVGILGALACFAPRAPRTTLTRDQLRRRD